jgi:transposase
MDVHSTSFTLSTFSLGDEKGTFIHTVAPDYKQVLLYLEMVRTKVAGINGNVDFICGYEAGSLGYTLYKQLTEHNVKCVILAPTTMLLPQGKRIKTDKRDAELIAKCLAYKTYHEVYIPDEEDNNVKEYIRMRDDHKKALTRIKQQILAFCLRNGHRYTGGNNWTRKHLEWIKELKLNAMLRETLDEYLITYENLTDKLNRMDTRIEELASLPRYKEKVKKLTCFIGVKTQTALATIVEISDFNRFAKAEKYASYLGLVPGENSSGDKQIRLRITKAGNTHVRKLMVEAAHSYGRGHIGYKPKAIKARQFGNTPETIAYADRANERLRRRYYKLISRGMKRNVAITAIARELSCFMWGLMTDNIA